MPPSSASVDEPADEPAVGLAVDPADGMEVDWHRRVVGRSLRSAAERSVDRGQNLIHAAAAVLARSERGDITVQEVADEAGQSLRTLYQYFESKDDLLLAVFEEGMRTYAQMIRDCVQGLDDPIERLAGAMLAAIRIPEQSPAGVDRGLARLRLRLAGSEPRLVGRAQLAVTGLFGELLEAAGLGGDDHIDAEGATFIVVSLNGNYITSETLGNDTGVPRPEAIGLVAFLLRGFGAPVELETLERIDRHVRVPAASA